MSTTVNAISRMTEEELAEHWHLKKRTLQNWRSASTGPVYIKIGGKPLYPMEEIIAFEKARTYKGTGEKISPDKEAVL